VAVVAGPGGLGTALLPVLLGLFWVAFLSVSVRALAHVRRSDHLTGRGKATLMLLIVIVPLVSTLAIFVQGPE
jgi:hypothetical protein